MSSKDKEKSGISVNALNNHSIEFLHIRLLLQFFAFLTFPPTISIQHKLHTILSNILKEDQ